nr:pyridoxamine 5'-phosphate oxidase family protein [Halomonas sp. UBA3074]
MSSPEHKQKIWKMIKDIKVGMLVTSDHDTPRARPMHLVQE